jgi:hypothetical protein
MDQLSYRRHRFPPPIIQHAIWLYLRFTPSYRDVQELLAERGLDEYGHGISAALHELHRKRRLLPLAVAERFARAPRPNLSQAGVRAIALRADRDALDLLLAVHNASSESITRDTASNATETLAGRLGLITGKGAGGLKMA